MCVVLDEGLFRTWEEGVERRGEMKERREGKRGKGKVRKKRR